MPAHVNKAIFSVYFLIQSVNINQNENALRVNDSKSKMSILKALLKDKIYQITKIHTSILSLRLPRRHFEALANCGETGIFSSMGLFVRTRPSRLVRSKWLLTESLCFTLSFFQKKKNKKNENTFKISKNFFFFFFIKASQLNVQSP